MKIAIVLAFLLVFALPCIISAQAPAAAPRQLPDTLLLTPFELMRLSREGVDDNLLIDHIHKSNTRFTLTEEDARRLSDGGVSEQVIEALNGQSYKEPIVYEIPYDESSPRQEQYYDEYYYPQTAPYGFGSQYFQPYPFYSTFVPHEKFFFSNKRRTLVYPKDFGIYNTMGGTNFGIYSPFQGRTFGIHSPLQGLNFGIYHPQRRR